MNANGQTPHICLQYADQLAAEGMHQNALDRYEQALEVGHLPPLFRLYRAQTVPVQR
jgi:hypothetical protein